MAGAEIDSARPSDAADAAVLSSAKRAEYEECSPVFWRVAENAREIHEPFLAKCIEDNRLFTSQGRNWASAGATREVRRGNSALSPGCLSPRCREIRLKP